jgi:hypothetical protein
MTPTARSTAFLKVLGLVVVIVFSFPCSGRAVRKNYDAILGGVDR